MSLMSWDINLGLVGSKTILNTAEFKDKDILLIAAIHLLVINTKVVLFIVSAITAQQDLY